MNKKDTPATGAAAEQAQLKAMLANLKDSAPAPMPEENTEMMFDLEGLKTD